MSQFFEDLRKDLIEAIEAEKGEREFDRCEAENLPADTYIIREKEDEYKTN